MKVYVLAAMACLVAGCATAPTDIDFGNPVTNFSGTDEKTIAGDDAVILLAIGPIGTGGGYQLQKLNPEQTDFDGAPVPFGFGAWGVGDKMKRPEGEKSNLWVLNPNEINFLIKKAPSGQYAATYVTWNIASPVSTGFAWNCLTDGAATYDVQPGKINIISTREAFPKGTVTRLAAGLSDEDILAQFEKTRLNYPDLKGDPVILEANGEARWTEAKGGIFSGECQGAVEGSLSVSRIKSSTDDAEPDDAEKAAIDAAIANLKKSTTRTQEAGDTK